MKFVTFIFICTKWVSSFYIFYFKYSQTTPLTNKKEKSLAFIFFDNRMSSKQKINIIRVWNAK